MKFRDQFPEGKLRSSDEGVLDIKMGIDAKSGKFVMAFGEPTAWIAMSKEQAYDFARAIMRHVVDKVITLDIPEKQP